MAQPWQATRSQRPAGPCLAERSTAQAGRQAGRQAALRWWARAPAPTPCQPPRCPAASHPDQQPRPHRLLRTDSNQPLAAPSAPPLFPVSTTHLDQQTLLHRLLRLGDEPLLQRLDLEHHFVGGGVGALQLAPPVSVGGWAEERAGRLSSCLRSSPCGVRSRLPQTARSSRTDSVPQPPPTVPPLRPPCAPSQHRGQLTGAR